MPAFDPQRVALLHFTHIDNFDDILELGGIASDNYVRRAGLLRAEVGDTFIKQRRREWEIDVAPGTSAADYVPFYFAPRSPMLYRISRDGVASYRGGQTPLVYFITSVGAVVAAELDHVFSDGNCATAVTTYATDLAKLETHVDWPLMKERYWKNTAEDPDRMRRRQAEFLVREMVPFYCFLGFVVRSQSTKAALEARVGGALGGRAIRVRPGWYF